MMSVVHNMVMMNAERQFGIVSGRKAKSTEKLSSGYKINRAADDAAGLSMSEKMRRQIRGLKQGSENIQEGISLVQVADGALAEVVDVLQRINELSVKAYNDTNNEEDRDYIQAEVTQLIKEIERISDDTTYNEMQLLKGNPIDTVTVVPDTWYTTTKKQTVLMEIPDWLKKGVDTELQRGHSYTGTQEKDGIMVVSKKNGSKYEYTYYGPNKGNNYGENHAKWGNREWTDTISDNAAAKISFEGLLDSANAVDLYNNLYGLLGCSIGVPCGTCSSQFYGINFTGTVGGITANASGYLHSGTLAGGVLNLTNLNNPDLQFTDDNGKKVTCFDKVAELLGKHSDDTLSDQDKADQTKALADEIAKKIRNAAFNVMTNVTSAKDHFDRALVSGDYDIIVYDYRDIDMLTNQGAADASVQTRAYSVIETPLSYLHPGTTVEVQHPLWIVASCQDNDRIPINLPLVTAETLGITGYDISRYKVIEEYSDSYKDKVAKNQELMDDYRKELAAWSQDYTEIKHEDEVEETYVKSSTPDIYADVYINGEKRRQLVQRGKTEYGTKKVKRTWTTRQYNSPRPTMPPLIAFDDSDIVKRYVYDGDSNRKIKDALSYVLRCRTDLGATQNRLEHAYNNNRNKEENMTASESRIRDTDIADEMVRFSNLNILQQAGQAVLSHGMQDRQYILSLLQ